MNKLSALLLALAALIASATAETTRLPVRGGASLQPSAQYALTYGHRLSARGADTPIGAELVFDSDLPVVHLDAVGSAVFKRGAEDSIEVTAGSEALKAISEWPEKTVVALDAKVNIVGAYRAAAAI